MLTVDEIPNILTGRMEDLREKYIVWEVITDGNKMAALFWKCTVLRKVFT